MRAFVVRRVLSGVLLIVLLTFLTFLVFQLIPVNPGCLRVACGPGSHSTDADIRAADHQLGVDRPLPFQYARFVWRFIRHGSLGTTWIGELSVNQQISQALPITASIVIGGVILLLLLAIPLGSFAALRPRSPEDRGLLALGVVGIAIHPFVLAIIVRNAIGLNVGLPTSGYCALTSSSAGCGGPVDWASHLVLPWLCFALFFLPLYLRMIRVRILDTLGEPYVVTARAKGASEARVVRHHVLRNALGPVLPMVAADAGTALTAAIYLEVIFLQPGLGRLAVTALSGRSGGYDRPLIVGIVATVATGVVVLTVLSDIGSAFVDPRVRMQTSSGLIRLPRVVAESPLARIPKIVSMPIAAAAVAALGVFIYTRNPPKPSLDLLPPVRGLAVHWHETHTIYTTHAGDSITVDVRRVRLGRQGWRVDASLVSHAAEPIVVQPGTTVVPANGFSLVYAQVSQGYNQLRVLNASVFLPRFPSSLAPGQAWHGTFGGFEHVPHGHQFYAGFGAFNIAGNTATGTSFLTRGSGVTP